MGTKRQPRRSDEDDDRDDKNEDRGRGRRRKPSGGGRGVLALVIVAVVLLISVPLLGVTGFLLWRFMAPGAGLPSIGLPGLNRPRDRLVGLWETASPVGFQGSKLTYDFRADGNFTSSLDMGNGIPMPAPATWEVKSENGNLVKLKMRPPLTDNQRRDFGNDLNSYDLDVEILSDNQIRVTSFLPTVPVRVAAVRVFDRKR